MGDYTPEEKLQEVQRVRGMRIGPDAPVLTNMQTIIVCVVVIFTGGGLWVSIKDQLANALPRQEFKDWAQAHDSVPAQKFTDWTNQFHWHNPTNWTPDPDNPKTKLE